MDTPDAPAAARSAQLVKYTEWVSDELSVWLAPAAASNEHPAQLTPESVAAALAEIQISSGPDTQPLPLIPEKRRSAVAAGIAAALARAGLQQDVVFQLLATRRTGLISSARYQTAARVFFADGALHVIVGAASQDYREDVVTQQSDTRPRLPAAGRRDQASKLLVTLQATPPVQFAADRGDWLVIPIEKIAPASKPASPPAARVDNSDAKPTGSRSDPGLRRRLRERLDLLRELRDEGLISEQAYERKTRELLDAVDL